MAIRFRDRPLREGERTHCVCTDCEAELHHDVAYGHNCNPLAKEIYQNPVYFGLDLPKSKII